MEDALPSQASAEENELTPSAELDSETICGVIREALRTKQIFSKAVTVSNSPEKRLLANVVMTALFDLASNQDVNKRAVLRWLYCTDEYREDRFTSQWVFEQLGLLPALTFLREQFKKDRPGNG